MWRVCSEKGLYRLLHGGNIHAHHVVYTLSGAAPIDGRGECHTRNAMEMENKGKMS